MIYVVDIDYHLHAGCSYAPNKQKMEAIDGLGRDREPVIVRPLLACIYKDDRQMRPPLTFV